MSSNNNCANNECPHQQAECPAAEGCGGFIDNDFYLLIDRKARTIKVEDEAGEKDWTLLESKISQSTAGILHHLQQKTLQLEEEIDRLNTELSEYRQSQNCDHAGKCDGCNVKQSECFAYHHHLFKKYEKIALKYALELDQYRQIGKPHELRKVTFCRDCIFKVLRMCSHYNNQIPCKDRPMLITVAPEHYCSYGEPEEDREG